MTTNCALCGQPVSSEQVPIQYDADGLPIALAVRGGFNVPVGQPLSRKLRILLDGKEISDVIGFDRSAGRLWRTLLIDGHAVLRDDEIAVEQLSGTVTVEHAD